MASTGISQKEYLKKYLSSRNDDRKKKKKKLKINPAVNRMKIVDDDIDISTMQPLDNVELELYDLQEDAPQIAGIIDERPEEVRIKEKFETKKWRVVADENDEGLKVIDKSNSNVSRDTKGTNDESDGDMSPPRKIKIGPDVSKSNSSSDSQKNRQYDSDESLRPKPRSVSDDSPQRKIQMKDRAKYEGSDVSPPRKSRKNDVVYSQNENDSDESPPRKNKESNYQHHSTNKKKYQYDSDESPPRRSKRSDTENVTCDRRNKHEEPSPSRSRKDYGKTAFSHRSTHKYDSDESPPRRNKRSYSDNKLSRQNYSKRNHKQNSPDQEGGKCDSDESPPRKNYRDSSLYSHSLKGKLTDADDPPFRRRKSRDRELFSKTGSRHQSSFKQENKKETSPSYRGSRNSVTKSRDFVENMNKIQRKNDSDESPPRRSKRASISPPNRSKRRFSESPPHRYDKRKFGNWKENMLRRNSRWNNEETKYQRDSPKTRSPTAHHKNSGSFHRQYENSDKGKEGKRIPQSRPNDDNSREQSQEMSENDHKKLTMDGRKAGLVDAGELKTEIANLRLHEKLIFANMDPSISGKGAAPVMRDRKTGKKRDLEEEARVQREKDEKQAERDSKYMQWGKGLKQVSDQEQKIKEALREMSKPLARYADDEDLDKYLREQEREGDPMLAYIKNKKGEKEKGKPQYEGSYMPNRFGIRPGHRWDGVDRSNGYEKQWFEAQNARKAVEEEAYKWSTSDM